MLSLFFICMFPPATADLSNLKINLWNEEKKKFQNIFLNIILVQFFSSRFY